MELSRFNRLLLAAIGDGAEVYSWRSACELRRMERAGLVAIAKAGDGRSPKGARPFFRAAATPRGRMAAKGGMGWKG